MFATHRKIVQLLLLYCIVVQSGVLSDVGSTLTQSNAKSEISGEAARLAEDDFKITDDLHAQVIRRMAVRKAQNIINKLYEDLEDRQRSPLIVIEEDNDSGRKDIYIMKRDTANKQYVGVRDIELDRKGNDRVLRATNERDRPFKEEIGQSFHDDLSFDSQDIDNLSEEFIIKPTINLLWNYALFSFKRLVEMVEQTKSSVDQFLGLLNLVEHKLELTDKRPISTESSDHSTTSPIVKQSVSSNNHQNVENHSVPEIYNVSDNSVYEDNPSPRETIHSHRNKRTLRVPKKRNTTTIRPYK